MEGLGYGGLAGPVGGAFWPWCPSIVSPMNANDERPPVVTVVWDVRHGVRLRIGGKREASTRR